MQYGAIVIGGGHNGLICAAYLARAGIPTVVLEARDSVGGCASTVDALDARVNICNCDHVVFRTTPVIDELGLADHGLRYLDPDPSQVQTSWSGEAAWPVFHDVDRTLDALRLIHPEEVEGYRHYLDAAIPVAELVLEMANEPPKSGWGALEARASPGSRRGDLAAMEPIDGRGRPAVVLHTRGDHGPRGDHWPGRVGPIPIRPADGPGRAHLRDEARRPCGAAGRRQWRGARQCSVGVRGSRWRGTSGSTRRRDPQRGDPRARGRARRRHRARGAARDLGLRSARDVRAVAARPPSGCRSSRGEVAGQARRRGLRVEDRRRDHRAARASDP